MAASASAVMPIGWRAAMSDLALKMPATELKAARDPAITSVYLAADLSGRVPGQRNSVGLRKTQYAAGCLVGVGARSKIPV